MTYFKKFAKIKHELKRQSFWKKFQGFNFNIIILGLIVLVSFLYLIQVNSVAAKGFEIKDLEKRIEELKDGNKDLELKVAEFQSRGYIEKEIQKLNMVAVSNVDYITTVSTVVAYK